MNSLKKTIMLTNKEKSNMGMALLTLCLKNNNIYGTLKAYNMDRKKNYVLGLKSGNQIIKQNITFSGNSGYNFICSQIKDLDEKLGCVLLKIDSDKIVPILWGSEKGDNYKSQIICNLHDGMQRIKSNNTIPTKTITNFPEQSIDKADANTNENLQKRDYMRWHNTIDDEIHSQSFCAHDQIFADKYDQISMEEELHNVNPSIAQVATMSSLFESSDEEVNDTIDKELSKSADSHKFYGMIAEQLNELFEKYPSEKNLENLVENSKWVKIKYEDSEKHYVVGLIKIEGDVKYICYGVPGNYNNEPPIEFKGYSQWLPVDTLNPYSSGYWVMYQDADTGENIYIN